MADTIERSRPDMMPTHFPQRVPAARPLGAKGGDSPMASGTASTDVTAVAVSFLTNASQLEELLPPGKGLSLRGDPIVTVSCVYQGGVAWLAGRGYNLIPVNFPVLYKGKHEEVHGRFGLVVWENMYEPIASGRERLGWSKLYAEIPRFAQIGDRVNCSASWDGTRFLALSVSNLRELTPEDLAERAKDMPRNDGSIQHKYIPRTASPGEADADYLTLSTNRNARAATVKGAWTGDGAIRFNHVTWEEIPTMAHIINALADLEVKEVVSAVMNQSTGGSMGDQRILE
jgi:acetoacetate decarboxylase